MKLSALKRKYEKNKKPFRKFIKHMDSSNLTDVAPIAQAVEKEVWKEVDCLSCANCCKKMTPTLSDADKKRISQHLRMSVKTFTEKYLAWDAEDEDWQMKVQPCTFLDQETNKCTIYEVRPVDCAGFPHLSKMPMEDYVYIHKQNIKYCPATYLWVEKMMDRITFKKEGE